ncbi:histone methylation protein DOT1-domain-containing protein [Schizophyllum commune]
MGTSRNASQTSPEPIYRHSSKSRSSSVLPPADDAPPPNQNREWRTEMDGRPGEYNRSSEKVVQAMEKDYKPYFDEFGHYREGYPRIELEYPNNNATEFFVPLYPKDPDHYNPLKDVVDSLHVIIGILDPQLQKLFGTLPEDVFSNLVSPESSPKSSPSSALSSPPSSQGSCNSSLTSLSTPCLSEAAAKALARANGDVLRCIRRALHTENGAMFIEFFEEAMRRMRDIKYPMLPQDIFADPPPNGPRARGGIPYKVLMRILEENYQRNVGPFVPQLRQYEAFSSKVYGELMPSLVYEMLKHTRLDENSLFLDLGCGVGNVVAQASLQTGCRSYGIECMETPARIASRMLPQFKARCRMWGVNVGEIELEHGDMLKSKRVDELIPQADVVLVNNKVFDDWLNENLRPKFLDLKEGAIVISLRPFVSSLNARVTERNVSAVTSLHVPPLMIPEVDDISTIFDVTERTFASGSVSWADTGGSYYVHRVDRAGYSEIRKRFESSRGIRSTRRTR